MHDPDYWKFSNEDGKLDRQYGGGGNHRDFCAALDKAVAYSKASGLARLDIRGLAQLRAIILTVIDDGCTCEADRGHPWELYEAGEITEAGANEQRLRLCEAVQAAILAQAAPALQGRVRVAHKEVVE